MSINCLAHEDGAELADGPVDDISDYPVWPILAVASVFMRWMFRRA